MKKVFKISERIPDSSLFIIPLIFAPILIMILTKNIILTLIVAAILFFFYLRSGKIKIHDGQVIFIFGTPGSGKTLTLAKIAHDNKKKRKIIVNEELEHLTEKDAVIKRSDIGKYIFGSPEAPALIMYDEVSLDGFDNRNHKTNFQGKEGEAILKGFKKCRHRYTGVVLANQGWNEVDVKIRSGLCSSAYWVKNRGMYSVAIRLTKDIKIDNLTGEPRDEYIRPGFIQRLIDPSCYVYISHKKYGKMIDTYYDESLPYYFDSAPAADGALTAANPIDDEKAKEIIKEALSKINAENKEK